MFVLSVYKYWPGYNPAAIIPNSPETWHVANNLRVTGNFANPFNPLNTGPSAHLAPLFPVFLAILTKVFGTHAAGAFAYRFADVLAVSVLLGLFPVVSRALGIGALTGFVAASIWLGSFLPLFPGWEATYAAGLLVIATCCFRRILVSGTICGAMLLLGILMGVLALTAPTCLTVFLCWLIWLAWSRRTLFFRPATVALLIIVPALIVSPWIIRNYLVFHRIILTRDDLGEAVASSNNDCADFSIIANKANGCFMKVHPNGNLREAEKVLAMGEPRYNDMRLHEAVLWITGHPHRFLSLSAQRFAAFWLPHETGKPVQMPRGRQRVIIYLMTGLSVVGLLVAARRDMDGAILCALWLCVYPIPYYVVQFESRYRQPVLWVTFLLGALPLSIMAQRLWNLSFRRERMGSARSDGGRPQKT